MSKESFKLEEGVPEEEPTPKIEPVQNIEGDKKMSQGLESLKQTIKVLENTLADPEYYNSIYPPKREAFLKAIDELELAAHRLLKG